MTSPITITLVRASRRTARESTASSAPSSATASGAPIGSGEAESTVPFGYDYSRPVAALEQALIEMRSLFDTGAMPSGVGRTGLDRSSVPEIWVAAQRPRMLRLTGRYADGWLPLPSRPEEYAEQLAVIRRALIAAS